MLNDTVILQIICPDCKCKLNIIQTEGTLKVTCSSCNRTFTSNNGIINLLPKAINNNKRNEELLWSKGGYFSTEMGNAPKFVINQQSVETALVYKHDDIRYLLEQILPKYIFEGNILEIGSGNCYGAAFIKKSNSSAIVIASDISPSALEIGIHLCESINTKIDYFISCDCESIPFEDNSFDIVFGAASLHHLSNTELGIAEIFRVLKKGGLYIGIREPASNRFFRKIWKSKLGSAGSIEKNLGVKDEIYHIKEWRNFFKKAGFEKIDIKIDKKWEFHSSHWSIMLYYKFLSLLPDYLVASLFLHGIDIIASK